MSNIIKIGTSEPSVIKIGTTSVAGVYVGTVKVYPQQAKDYLRTVARGTGEISLTIGSAVTTTQMTSISYSLDGYSWTTLNNVDDTTITASVSVASGDTVYWKGVGVQTAIAAPSRSGGVPKATIFSSDVNFDVEGNAMSILFGDNFEGEEFDSGSTYHLSGLFCSATTLVNASGMTLPATTVCENDYNDMFYYCSGLTSAPSILSATTIGASSYKRMFQGCTSLTAAPQISATTMNGDQNCDSMFYGCTSLTTAPSVLPATTLTANCYRYMFQNCTSLTVATSLPATTLANNCYYYMFTNCTSLTTAPQLPATTLTDYCYGNMFQGCTSLTTAPYLPATRLAYYCYSNMFYNCSSLNRIECNAVTYNTSTTADARYWVSGVAASGKFIQNSSNTWWTTGVNGIPTNWSVGTLPAERTDWVKADVSDYICDSETYTKYYKEYLEETTDGGITWSYVTPLSSRTSEDVIEYDSTDCGYVGSNYFTIKSLVASNTITLKNATTGSTVGTTSFAYSTNSGSTWTNFTIPTGQTYTIATIGENETVMLKGNNNTLGNSYNRGHFFRGSGDYEIQGNIMSLLTGNDTDTEFPTGSSFSFAMLFSGDTHLVSAENLVIPASAMTRSAFNSVFRSCTNLTKAPELPATVLAKECYSSMFESCISLSQPPSVLSADTIGVNDAYSRMFCMSRTSMVSCQMTYSPKMYGNYTVAPYNQQMFAGNGNLTDVECYWTYNGTINGLTNWMQYTNSTGTFKKLSAQEFGSGVNGIPDGWTVINV